MKSNDKLKEIDIKNCMCYYLDDIMIGRDFDFDNILLDVKSYENSYENILFYDISYIWMQNHCVLGGLIK